MKNRALVGCTFLLMVATVPLAAQQTSDAPDRAQVLQFLDLMHARSQMTQVLDGMAKQMRIGAAEGFKKKVPDATPEQLAKLDKICDNIFASLSIDEFIDAMVPIYQKHLTKADLAAATAFYSSPAGQKILKELPSIMSESMQVGGEIGRKTMANKSEDLDRQIADLVKESSGK